MTRAMPVVVIAIALALLAGVYTYRVRRAEDPRAVASVAAVHDHRPSAPVAGAPDGSAAPVPRGPVSIDPRRQQLIGIRTVAVSETPLDSTLRTVGVVRYDETRQAEINLRVEGWIRDLYVASTGAPVRRGQPLLTLYSPDLVATEQEYLLALQTRDQVQGSQIADARERADQLVAAAKQRLLLWELPPDELRTLEDMRRVADAVTFRSPVSGVVVEKQALKGLHVVPGQMLYRVADLSTVWVEADVYERDVADLHPGATATVRVDAYPGEPFTGRVLYIYPYLDEKTRTNRVRFAFANRAGRLKPGMFATVELKGRRGTALTVPMNAVLDSGEEQIVFLAQGNGVYQPRRVKVGRRAGESIEILEGLTAGEQVAEGAAFFLDSESQLRASLQAYAAAPPPAGTAPAAGARISLRTQPEPAAVGENHVEATVTDASGRPIVDATVTMQASMPAMPSMNMPAMRTQTQLTPAGDGVYRGAAHLMSAGRWDTTIAVVKDGEEIGRRSAPLTVR